jgi:hypothetical protein
MISCNDFDEIHSLVFNGYGRNIDTRFTSPAVLHMHADNLERLSEVVTWSKGVHEALTGSEEFATHGITMELDKAIADLEQGKTESALALLQTLKDLG